MNQVKIILQARLDSMRLPGKMLLPVAGLPLVVLCARRVEKTGYPLVVATSVEASDDLLCDTLEDYGITYVRGSLHDVLGRFVLAAEGMKDTDRVVRLTGDNPLVDGKFVSAIIAHHELQQACYTRSLSPLDGLPYGISAEVINAGLLRKLHQEAVTDADREHVTTYLVKSGQFSLFHSPYKEDLSHLRVSIDTFSDYRRVAGLFNVVKQNALEVGWKTLIDVLQSKSSSPSFRTPYQMIGLKPQSKLALGTAQLGQAYGIANRLGKPSTEEARKILNTALDYGVTSIDTAAAYGTAELVIGTCLDADEKQRIDIHTKLDPLPHLINGLDKTCIRDAVQSSVYKSCHNLGLKVLPLVMLHRWEHLKACDGHIWQNLLDLRSKGVIQKLGVSVQSPEEALEALDEPEIKFIQMPFNILDWRWRESGFIENLSKRKDIHIQARSSLLQGLVTLPAEKWPVIKTSEASQILNALEAAVDKLKRKSVPDLCYAYVRSLDWVHSIVVGVETKAQLIENLNLFNEPALLDVQKVENLFSRVDTRLLNPAEWGGK